MKPTITIAAIACLLLLLENGGAEPDPVPEVVTEYVDNPELLERISELEAMLLGEDGGEEQSEPPESLLDVWFYHADWCVPCQRMKPLMDRLELDGVTVHRVDCTGQNYIDIRAYPTVRLYRGTELVDTIEGLADETYLRRVIGITDDTVHNPDGAGAIPTDNDVGICCCQDRYVDRCLCVAEIRAGIQRPPCGCSSTHGTRHYLDDRGRPLGPVPDNGRPHLVPLNADILNFR